MTMQSFLTDPGEFGQFLQEVHETGYQGGEMVERLRWRKRVCVAAAILCLMGWAWDVFCFQHAPWWRLLIWGMGVGVWASRAWLIRRRRRDLVRVAKEFHLKLFETLTPVARVDEE
jgi:hypothetical protein